MITRALPLLVVATLSAVGIAASPAAQATTTPGGVVTSTATPPNGVAGQDVTYSLTVGGLNRSYTLYVPPTLTSGARLVVALHPLNGSPSAIESTTNLDAGAANNHVLVAYPAGIGNSWNGGTCCGPAQQQGVDDVSFINAVISDVGAHYSVNAAKVAVGGFSNGGIMAYRFACEQSSQVRVFFIASATSVAPKCALNQHIALLHMHGLADTTVPYNGTTTSPYPTDGVLPAVPNVVGGVANLDGCSGGFAQSTTSSGATKYVANNCPTGSSVTVFTSPNMGHFWVTGSASATYHLDETGLAWSYLLSN